MAYLEARLKQISESEIAPGKDGSLAAFGSRKQWNWHTRHIHTMPKHHHSLVYLKHYLFDHTLKLANIINKRCEMNCIEKISSLNAFDTQAEFKTNQCFSQCSAERSGIMTNLNNV